MLQNTMKHKLTEYFLAKAAYYDGAPIMSDAEFDAFEQELSKTHPEILTQVGSTLRGGKVALPIKMGSLNQIRNQKEWSNWGKTYPNEKIVFTEKIDGNSCLLEYRNGVFVASYSRGDGTHGANNFRHTSKMKTIPKQVANFTGYVRGELVIPKPKWESCLAESGRDYANARNFVAGFMNASESDINLYKYFDFVAFETYTDIGFSKTEQLEFLKNRNFICPKAFIASCNYNEVEILIQKILDTSNYEVDGVVAEVDSPKYRVNKDLEDLNPEYACKIKLVSEGVQTEVTGVEWSASKDGLLKPVVLIKPITLSGATISRASGYNAKFIKDNGIGPGAIVTVVRSGDVIPKIICVVSAVVADLPNGVWNETGVDLIGSGQEVEDVVQSKRLQYFFHKMKIDFVGAGNVSKLINAGYAEPMLIVKTPAALEQVIGENGRKAAVIMNGVLQSTTPQRLFAALGMFGRGIGERKLKALFSVHDYEQVLGGTVSDKMIVSVDGFDIKTAKLITGNLVSANKKFNTIKDLVKFEKEAVRQVSGALANEVIVASGVRLKGDQLEKVVAIGGTVSDSLNKSTTILVVKDLSSSSSKMLKAASLCVKIVSLVDFLKLIG